jgi:hypothetical protein
MIQGFDVLRRSMGRRLNGRSIAGPCWVLLGVLLWLPGAALSTGAQPAVAAPAVAQAQETTSVLEVASVEVTPAKPGANTLCQLSVRLTNRSAQPVYALSFAVTVGGVELPIYRDQLFLQKLPAEQTSEVKLFNFWSEETGRPLPKDGKLAVVVELREAQFLLESSEAEEAVEEANTSGSAAADADGAIEVWKPGGAVPGLPVSAALTLEIGG